MAEDNVQQLAQTIGRTLCRCDSGQCAATERDLGLCRTLICLLGQGQPVTVAALARETGLSTGEVTAVVESALNVELDEQGRIVGAGLSLRPTPHRLTLDGRTLFTWCALDALMYPPFLGETVAVESPCAASGDPVRLLVTVEGVTSVSPADAVVSIVRPDAALDVRRGFCNDVHFFRSPQAAAPWLAQHPQAVLISVVEAFALGQQLTRA